MVLVILKLMYLQVVIETPMVWLWSAITQTTLASKVAFITSMILTQVDQDRR
jgi:hypothetical protein